MVGRSAPIILSADLTVRCNLFLSSLVAKPNQTVMDVHIGVKVSILSKDILRPMLKGTKCQP